jgi:hypothetical protein
MNPTETLALERAVQRVYLDYCDVIDEKRFDDLDQIFTSDCEGDYRDGGGVVMIGLTELIAGLHRNLGPGSTCGGTHHNVLNFRIDALDESHAETRVHFYAVHRGAGAMSGELYSVWGCYRDQVVLGPDGWRIAKRRYTNYVTDGDKAVIRQGVPQAAAPPSMVSTEPVTNRASGETR